MSFLDPTTLANAAQAGNEPKEVSTALESMLVKQLITSSGLFQTHGSSAGGGAGVKIRAELFAETLADAVSKSGQLDLHSAVEKQLTQALPSVAPTLAAPTRNDPSAGMVSPLATAASHLTSAFGARVDPIDGATRQHNGVDIGAEAGTPIVAASDGVVVSAGSRGGYGQAVEIQHAGGVSTLYAHASALLVQAGDRVVKGQQIAKVGQTGRATGPHLHFEVRQGGRALNPTRALSAYSRRAEGFGKTRGKP